MVKANNIKLDKNMPIKPINPQDNSNTTGTQNTIPTTSTTQSNNNKPINTDPLWKQGIRGVKNAFDKFDNQIQSDKAKLKEELRTGSWKDPNITTPYVPRDTFEQTAGGWNYSYDRAVSQEDNQQGHYNALNDTGHVVGIPEREGMTLNTTEYQRGERMPERTSRLGDLRQPKVVNGTTATPVNNTNVGIQNRTVQPAVSNQNPQQQERIVTPDEFGRREVNPDEFGGLKGNQPEQQQSEQRPGMDLQETPGGVIYGRASGDEGTRIETQADPYNAEAYYMAGRQTNYDALQKMNSYDIAVSVTSGYDPYGSQAMRDLMQYDPSKYQEVQDYIKQIQGEENINNIATNGTINAKSQTEKATDTVNNSITSWVNKNSNERNSSQVQSMLTDKLANSQVANNATQEMLSLNAQMADIQEKMANLPDEAKKAFKGDAPQYIMDAYVSNNTQRLQSELNKLQSRYNGAIDLYKTELSQKQWETEMELKQRQYNFNVSQQNWENAFKTRQQNWTEQYQAQSLRMNNIKTDSKGRPYVINTDGTYTYLSDATYSQAVQQQIDMGIDTLNTVYKDGAIGGQCEAFSDNFNNTLYGKTMLPVDQSGNYIQGRTATTAWEKAQYVNSAMPSKGMTAIFNYGNTANVSDNAKKRGHTMVVTGYDPNTGIISLKGSNRSNDEKVYSTTMSLDDFYNKYRGVGFWDPTQPTRFETQEGVVGTVSGGMAMQPVFDDLFTNATTDGQRNVLATAETMYNTLADIRDDGTLYELIKSKDLEKMLLSFKQKDFTKAGEDGGTLIMTQISKYIQNNAVNVESQIALNKFLRLIEMKLRKESGAAISSSEWYSNFQMMIPQSYENERLMYSKLDNWDDLIRLYARTGGMKSRDEYIPLFTNGVSSGREIW